ncbi:NADH-ubiquinone oxidoreductase-F iron-sulfur binding region domain-containing protein [Wukongibacter sp. M2B1]|uniref:NADH-ubiquinone oxidoreductase-F iron-sulfur binding region domain-containing protein n=1 Tax=Wukongibacter sp. M2B1 TaxID=3088895 RepID=UPI003D78DA4E
MNDNVKTIVDCYEDIDLYKKKFKIVLKNVGGKIRGERLFEVLQIKENLVDSLAGEYNCENIKLDFFKNIGSMMEQEDMDEVKDGICILDAVKNYLDFLSGYLCGKCVTCREGTRMMNYIVGSITNGMGIEKDIDILIDLCEIVKESSPCVLGKTAPDIILTSIEYFRDDYIEHIIEKKCSAGICEGLASFEIKEE